MYKKCSFKILLVSMVVLLSSCTMMTERNSGEVAINISTSRNITDELKDATYTVTLFKSDGSIFDEKTTTSNEVKFTLIPRGDYIIKLVGETSRYILKGEASVTVNPGVENEAKLPVTYKMKTGNKFTATPIQRGIDLFIPSVDKAVTASILCYNTENQKKSFIDINAKNGYFGFVTDYFVQKDKVYNFTITYFDSNRKIVSSDTIENIKAIGGKGDFALEVKPVATYTESSSILKFTELPKIKNNDFETTYEVIYSKIKEGKEFAYSGFISNGEIDFSTVAFNDDSLYGKPVYNPELAATVKLEPNINQYVFFEKEDCAKIAQEITVNAPKNSVVEGKGIEINLKPYWDNNPTAETIMINRTRNSSNNRVDNEYITVRANITENEQGDIIQTIKEPTVTDYFVNNGDNYSYEIVVCDMDSNPLGASDKLKAIKANGGVGELKITTPIKTNSSNNGIQSISNGKPDFSQQNAKLQKTLGETQENVPKYITLGLCYKDDFNEVRLYDTDYSGEFDWNSQYISGTKISFVSANVGYFCGYISYEVIYDANTNVAAEKELISGIEKSVFMPTEPPVVPGPSAPTETPIM